MDDCPALQLFGAGREKRVYAIPPYTSVRSLDFEDHPFEVQRFAHPCALCAAEGVYLDEVVLDDRGGRMFVCSDTDHCEERRANGHRGAMLADAPDALRGGGRRCLIPRQSDPYPGAICRCSRCAASPNITAHGSVARMSASTSGRARSWRSSASRAPENRRSSRCSRPISPRPRGRSGTGCATAPCATWPPFRSANGAISTGPSGASCGRTRAMGCA